MLDDLTPYYMQRWIGTLILGVLYIIRAFTAGGWYIVTVMRFFIHSTNQHPIRNDKRTFD